VSDEPSEVNIRIAWLGCQNDMQSSLTRNYLLDKNKRKKEKKNPSPKNRVVIVTPWNSPISFWKSPFNIALK
jgi:hypothetical protein